MFEDKRLARLRWACRRGMLELDVLLLPFVDSCFGELSFEQQELFEDLLTCDDPDLFAWFMGHQECSNPDYANMIELVKQRVPLSNS